MKLTSKMALEKTKVGVLVAAAMFGLSACNDDHNNLGSHIELFSESSGGSKPSTPPGLSKPSGPSNPVAQKPCVTSTSKPNKNGKYDPSAPTKITLGLFHNCEMIVGQSRTIETRLLPDPSLPAAKSPDEVLKSQGLIWMTSDANIATVDQFGNMKALKKGEVIITAISKTNYGVKAQAHFIINSTPTKLKVSTRLVQGHTPAEMPQTLQKLVDRYSSTDTSTEAQTGRALLAGSLTSVDDGLAVWEIKDNSATGQGNSYVLRTDKSDAAGRNKIQYFMGNRYLPFNATIYADGRYESSGPTLDTVPSNPVAIASDGDSGIWILGQNNSLSHVRMVAMDPEAKASLMSDTTQRVMARRGQVDEAATRDIAKRDWKMGYGDSTPIWTGLYASGELMRYAVLKNEKADAAEIEKARKIALASLKHELMLANVTGRKGSVQAKLRVPVYQNDGNLGMMEWALLKGRDYAVDINPFGPTGMTQKNGTDGEIFDKPVEETPHNLTPIVASDWVADQFPVGDVRGNPDTATTERMIEGLTVRHFALAGATHHGVAEVTDANAGSAIGGNLWKREVSGKARLVQFSAGTVAKHNNRFGGEYPYLSGKPAAGEALYYSDASLAIPDVLACKGAYSQDPDCINMMQDETGAVFSADNVYYKTETSYDGMISILFTMRIAYDILDENNPEELGLKHLISDTMRTWAEHNIANGYMMVDANGQPNRWTNVSRLYLSNDGTWEDRNLYAAQILAGMKLAAYVTGERRFEDEYQSLASSDFYDYAELAATRFSNYQEAARQYCRDIDPVCSAADLANPNYMDEWTREYSNIGDANHAAQVYYMLFTLEPQGSKLYKQLAKAYESQWDTAVKFEENPFHYYVRQLANPDEVLTDGYGNELLSTVAWGLTRHPVDTTKWSAYDISRPDIARLGLSEDLDTAPLIKTSNGQATVADVLDITKHTTLPQDERAIHTWNRSLRWLGHPDVDANKDVAPNSMGASTTYTFPYWMGRYHNFLAK